MKFALFGADVRLSPWLLPVMAATVLLGQGRAMAIAAGCLLVHEMSHLLMSAAVGCRVRQITVLPVGASMTLETPIEGQPGLEALVAAAGPLGNLLTAAFAVFVHRYLPYAEPLLRDIVRCSLTLCAFNLLPALPLDGGRLLRAALSPWLTYRRGTQIALWAGRMLGAAIVGWGIWGGINGVWNITVLSAGGAMMLASGREARLSAASVVKSLSGKREMLYKSGALEVRHLVAPASESALRVAAHLRPRNYHIITLLDDHMRPIGVLNEPAFLETAAAEKTLGELMREVSPQGHTNTAGRIVFDSTPKHARRSRK